MKPYERLADAIIIQAAEDYRQALMGKALYSYTRCEDTIKECEAFFRSGWFHALTNVDGELIMNRIKGEVYERITNSSNPKSYRGHHKNRIHLLRQ